MPEWWKIVALLLGGAAAGGINVLAGGGSLITMPLLIFVGVPPTMANGTARLALLVQTGTAMWRYRLAGALSLRTTARLSPPVLLGAAAGAFAGARLADADFRQLLGWVTLAAGVIVVVDLPRRLASRRTEDAVALQPWFAVALFVAGFYGGFMQAGVGYLLLAALTVFGAQSLTEANGYKIALNFVYTPLALIAFAEQAQIDWLLATVLAVGQGLGGWLAAGFALKRGAKLIRFALVAVVILAAAKLLFV